MEYKKTDKAIHDYKLNTEIKFPNYNTDIFQYINDSDYKDWEQKNMLEIQKIFNNEYNELIKTQNYFYGCTSKTYRDNYKIRLKEFLNKFHDTDEIDFLESELIIGVKEMPVHHMFVENETRTKIDYSLKKRATFLEEKVNNLGYSLYLDFDIDNGLETFRIEEIEEVGENLSVSKKNNLKWKGSPTELTALIKSLKESNKLDNSLSEKQIVERFEQFFSYSLKGYDQTKSKIRKRTKDLTPFIDKLKTNLEQWIKKKD